jgi:hypothetical protein
MRNPSKNMGSSCSHSRFQCAFANQINIVLLSRGVASIRVCEAFKVVQAFSDPGQVKYCYFLHG